LLKELTEWESSRRRWPSLPSRLPKIDRSSAKRYRSSELPVQLSAIAWRLLTVRDVYGLFWMVPDGYAIRLSQGIRRKKCWPWKPRPLHNIGMRSQKSLTELPKLLKIPTFKRDLIALWKPHGPRWMFAVLVVLTLPWTLAGAGYFLTAVVELVKVLR
jgi:hypothetical protein